MRSEYIQFLCCKCFTIFKIFREENEISLYFRIPESDWETMENKLTELEFETNGWIDITSQIQDIESNVDSFNKLLLFIYD